MCVICLFAVLVEGAVEEVIYMSCVEKQFFRLVHSHSCNVFLPRGMLEVAIVLNDVVGLPNGPGLIDVLHH